MRRREAALEQRAAVDELDLVALVEILRRELRMRHDDVTDARLDGGVDDGEDLVAPEVAGREHEAVPLDHGEHREQLRQRRAVLVDDRDRGGLDPLLARARPGCAPRAASRRPPDTRGRARPPR